MQSIISNSQSFNDIHKVLNRGYDYSFDNYVNYVIIPTPQPYKQQTPKLKVFNDLTIEEEKQKLIKKGFDIVINKEINKVNSEKITLNEKKKL